MYPYNKNTIQYKKIDQKDKKNQTLTSFLSTGERDQAHSKEQQGWRIKYLLSGLNLKIVVE